MMFLDVFSYVCENLYDVFENFKIFAKRTRSSIYNVIYASPTLYDHSEYLKSIPVNDITIIK